MSSRTAGWGRWMGAGRVVPAMTLGPVSTAVGRSPVAAKARAMESECRNGGSVNAKRGSVQWIRSQTNLAVTVKGIQHPDDARRAIDNGADVLY